MRCLSDVAIVGAGPAGSSAAIQARREGLSVLLFEKGETGGMARCARLIENIPGIPCGISGSRFASKLALQLRNHGVKALRAEVSAVTRKGKLFEIRSNKKLFRARAVIVACGLEGKRLGIPGEEENSGCVVPYPVPHEVPHRKKSVIVIGGGDTAFDQAISFSRRASSVTLAMRGEGPRSIPLLVAEARRAGVNMKAGHRPVSIEREGRRLSVLFAAGDGVKRVEADFVSLCIGRRRGTSPTIDVKKTPGLFFAGDCNEGSARHVAIAAGDGIAKAMAVSDFLKAF